MPGNKKKKKKKEEERTKERGDMIHAAVHEPDLVYAEPEQACSRDMTAQSRTSRRDEMYIIMSNTVKLHSQTEWLEAKGFGRLRQTPCRSVRTLNMVDIALRCRMRTKGGGAEFVEFGDGSNLGEEVPKPSQVSLKVLCKPEPEIRFDIWIKER
ncbi:unnamed protein product [Fusarium graminearum]|nr:unnamed protein product [Fusarium graminearum]